MTVQVFPFIDSSISVICYHLSFTTMATNEPPEEKHADEAAVIRSMILNDIRWTEDRLSALPYTQIVKLDLGKGHQLSSLPDAMPQYLPNLSILFLSNNLFVEMPAILSKFPSLQMIAFKSNGMKTIHPDVFVPQSPIRWLILTNNHLTTLPDSIQHCTKLQKFMLSGNQITHLPPPDHVKHWRSLELIRLACNRLTEPPWQLFPLPQLKWIALGNNPFLNDVVPPPLSTTVPTFEHIDVSAGRLLGSGASGITRALELPPSLILKAANRHSNDEALVTVAVKTYHSNATVTSDGTPELERHIALHVSHSMCQTSPTSGFIQVYGQCATTGSLVMEYLEDFVALAQPPDFDTCSRDVYPGDGTVQCNYSEVCRVITVVLSALRQLHAQGITHGDLYGHNLLIHPDRKEVRVSDFGAAFFYPRASEYSAEVELFEVRAFTVLVEEVVKHVWDKDGEDHAVQARQLRDFLAHCQAATSFDELSIHWQQLQLKDMAARFHAE
jgi:tRNA A-37 threonylcarbamoyl transferase component Bud32